MGKAVKDFTKFVIGNLQGAARHARPLVSSAFMALKFGDDVVRAGSKIFSFVSGMAGKVMGMFAIIGVVTDIHSLIACFEDNNIALGIFTTMSMISGVTAFISGVLGVASVA